MNKIEIVTIDGYYALRRTRRAFFFFKKIDFLSLSYESTVSWYPRDSKWFKECLTNDFALIKLKLAYNGSDLGNVVDPNALISADEINGMLKIAKTDEGMRDLLFKAKEFYILKRKK